MTIARTSAAVLLFLASWFHAFAQDDSKPVLMSTTGGGGWSDVKDLEKDVEAGKPKALAAYGEMLLMGDQVAKDVPRGIVLLERALAAGQHNAAFRLGKLYEDGELVARDTAKALEFYRKAALAGVSEAQYNLGAMYVSARGGVKRDYKEGLAWMIVATKNGAPAEGEQQVRERLKATRRESIIAEAEKRAADIEGEIKENAGAAGSKAVSTMPAKAKAP